MARIALTGEIGAGKSTAAKILAEKLNYELFNADLIAKDLWQNENIKNKLISHYKNFILDENNNIDLKKLAQIIFNDNDEYKFSCKLIHPVVMSELKKISGYNSVIEIPLIFEAGFYDWINYILYVGADFESRLKRCELQRGWDKNELLRREKFLMPRDQRIKLSGYIIYNDGDLKDLEHEILKFIEWLNKTGK